MAVGRGERRGVKETGHRWEFKARGIEDCLEFSFGVGLHLLIRDLGRSYLEHRGVDLVALPRSPAGEGSDRRETAVSSFRREPPTLQVSQIALELRAGQAIKRPGSSAAQVPIHPQPVPISGLIAAALDLEFCQPPVYEGHQRNDRRLRSLNGQGLKRALRQIGNGAVVRGDLVS